MYLHISHCGIDAQFDTRSANELEKKGRIERKLCVIGTSPENKKVIFSLAPVRDGYRVKFVPPVGDILSHREYHIIISPSYFNRLRQTGQEYNGSNCHLKYVGRREE